MKKRLGIFCFYDEEGIVDDYIEYLLNDLSSCLCRLIIVVNGYIDKYGMKIMEKYSDEIIIRKNEGFDAGAYKTALVGYLKDETLYNYDEIVFCNDTFFGPLVHFSSIFERMEQIPCDFWGINYIENNIANHLQSYFLVFRSGVIEDDSLRIYLSDRIKENNVDYRVACAEFEAGLFSYLYNEKGKKFASLVKTNNCHILKSCNYCLIKYGIPVIKRKAFATDYYNKENIMDVISFVENHTDYDVEYIFQAIKRRYSLCLKKEDISNYVTKEHNVKECFYSISYKREDEIKKFIEENKSFYIFGDGIWAVQVCCIYVKDNPGFKGFIISDKIVKNTNTILGYPVFNFGEVADSEKQNVMVILNYKNHADVCHYLDRVKNIFSLY